MIKPSDYTEAIINGIKYKVITPNLVTQRSYELPNGYYIISGVSMIQPQTMGIKIGEKPFNEANRGWIGRTADIVRFNNATNLYINAPMDTWIEVE